MESSDNIKLPFFGEIPLGWTSKSLQKISIKIGDGLHGTPKYSEDTEFHFVNGNNLENGVIVINESTKCVDEFEYIKHKKNLTQYTILISINGTIGKIAKYNGEKIVLGKSAAYIMCNEENLEFLFHVLQSEYVTAFFESELTGSTIRNLSLKSIRETPIPLPPLPEQQKIAAILSKWDELIEEQTKLIKAKEKQKTSLMQKLLSGEVRFPGFEGEWEEVTLGEIASCKRGSVLSKKDLVDNGKNYCIHYGELFTTYKEVIKEIKSKTNVTGFKSKAGDVLMPSSDVTPLGLAKACAITINDVILGGDINVIRLNQGNFGSFISYLLKHETNQILKYVSGTTVKHIYIKDIVQLKLKIPKNIDEQKKIVDFLSDCSEEIQSLKEELVVIKLQKKGLMQQLLTGRIRVEV